MERDYTLENIDMLAKDLLDMFGKPHASHAVLFGLQGDLGAGKTALVQAMARTLHVGESVTSPTFVIEKIYRLEGEAFEHLIHIDAYRLESSHELAVLGFSELVNDPKNLIVIEWPERVASLLPPHTQYFRLTLLSETSRRITHLPHGEEN